MSVLVACPSLGHAEALVRAGERAEPLTALAERLRTALAAEPRLADAVVLRRVLRSALRSLERLGDDPLLELACSESEQGARALAALWRAIQVARSDAIAPATLAAPRVLAVAPGAESLGRAVRAYVEAMAAHGLTDRPGALVRLASALAQTAPDRCVDVVGARVVEVRGVVAISAVDCAWLAALDRQLARAGGGLRVVLPTLELALDSSREPDALEPLSTVASAWLDAPVHPEAVSSSLGDRWLGGATESDRARAEAFVGADADAQARLVVRTVARALDAGASLDRVVVAYPSDAGRDAVEAALEHLERAAVATHCTLPIRVEENPLLTFAFDVATAGRRLQRREIARLLRSSYVDARALVDSETGEGAAARAVLDAVAARLERSRPPERESVEAALLELVGSDATPDGRARRRTLDRLLALLALPVRASTAREQVSAVRRLWWGLNLPARAASGGRDLFEHDGALPEAQRRVRAALIADARAWDALVRALDRFEMALEQASTGGEELSLEALLFELRSLVESESRAPRGGSVGALRLTPLSDVTDEPLDLLVVFEADSRALASAGSADALMTDPLRTEALRVEGRTYGLGPGSVRRARAHASLARAASRAARVVLVTRATDGEGSVLDPAPVVLELLHGGAASMHLGLLGALTMPIGPSELAVARAAAGAPVVARGVAQRADRERVREAFFLDEKRGLSADVGALAPSNAARTRLIAATGGADDALSVSRVDVMAACPFRAFATVVLRASERAEESDVPDARDSGTLVHEALRAAFDEARALFAAEPRDGALIEATARASIERSLSPLGSTGARGLQRERIAEDALAIVRAAVADRDWTYMVGEKPFGEPAPTSWGPLVLEAPSGPVRLRGRIDRVDEARDRRELRVVDYKRSLKRPAAIGVTELQLPLYVRVVARERACDTRGTIVAWQRRRSSSAPKSDSVAARIDEAVARDETGTPRVESRVVSLVESLRGGAIAPIPADASQCTYCEASGVCRRPRFAIAPELPDEEEVD